MSILSVQHWISAEYTCVARNVQMRPEMAVAISRTQTHCKSNFKIINVEMQNMHIEKSIENPRI